MGIFNNQNATAVASASSLGTEHVAGLDLHLSYHPTDMVWTIVDGKAVKQRVIMIKTEHRSAVSSSYQPLTFVKVVLESGLERKGSEVFMSKEELIAAL